MAPLGLPWLGFEDVLRLLDLLGLGTQKGGTSYLYGLLAEAARLADADAALHQDDPHRSHQQHIYLSRSRYEQQMSDQLRCVLRAQLEPTYSCLQHQGLEVLQP